MGYRDKKNLAYCVIEYKNDKQTIKDFDIINLIEDLEPEIHICSMNHKNGNKCKTKASYTDLIQMMINQILFML